MKKAKLSSDSPLLQSFEKAEEKVEKEMGKRESQRSGSPSRGGKGNFRGSFREDRGGSDHAKGNLFNKLQRLVTAMDSADQPSTSRGTAGTDDRACFTCKEVGHWSRTRPYKDVARQVFDKGQARQEPSTRANGGYSRQ